MKEIQSQMKISATSIDSSIDVIAAAGKGKRLNPKCTKNNTQLQVKQFWNGFMRILSRSIGK